MTLREVRRLYDRRAPYYDALVDALSLGRDGGYRRRAVEALDVSAGHRVLDVGCGTGRNFPLLPRGAVGVDPSRGILRVARRRVRRLAMAAACALPFPDACFDRVLCTYVLTTVPEWPRALDEMARLLAPGGRIVVADDRLPPGWFLGPGPMFRRLLRDGWVDIHRDVLAAMGARFADIRLDLMHFGLIYLICGTKRPQ
ncbi:MAG: methyltransferase domain-containing protein [Planctomycetes bacterium]|nr:methyltransferase domain-containing protein [Planctomycetota bacterium]